MEKIVNLLIYITLGLSFSAHADSPPLKLSHPGEKQEWLTKMQQDLPAVLCQEDRYFMQCFNVTKPECIEVTSLYVKACLNNITLALPTELNTEQGEYWGQMVGRCSYDLYEKFMEAKKRDTADCHAQSSTQQDLPKPSQAIP